MLHEATNHSSVQSLTIEEFHKLLQTKPMPLFFDIREKEEWETMHIEGVHHVPKENLPAYLAKNCPDKKTPIYLHCLLGKRSFSTAEQLIQLGYQTVYTIEGGIMAYEKAGYPVIK